MSSFKIYMGFSENRQILTDLSVKTLTCYHVFREIFAVFSVFPQISFFGRTVYAGRFLAIMARYGSDDFFLLYSRHVGLGRHRARFLNFSFAEIKTVGLSF